VYLETPVNVDSVLFIAGLSRKGVDIRGDRTDYVLAVDTHGTANYKSHVIFENYDSSVASYYVIERANVQISLSEGDALLKDYRWAAVKNTHIFAVPIGQEDAFLNKIPALFEAVLIPANTLPAPAVNTPNFKLPGAPDPVISNLISQVSETSLYDFVTYLSGESSPIWTRQSQSTGAVQAQDYLELQFAQYGFTVNTQPFRAGYSSNVVATLQGTLYPDQVVLVCCHYDCRGPTLTSTTNRAPGANDNGSGTGALLQIAKLIYDNKLSFAYTVILTAFSGEEQGLYGSAYAAQQYYNQKVDIIAVLNADMIAYRVPNAIAQLDFTSRSTTPALTTALTNITKTYVTGLAIGSTTACCTDSASFYDYGYPSISFCERGGYTIDPQYHQIGDLVNRQGYDIAEQYPLIVKSMFAGLLTIAEYH
jgi:hypothetical protein